MCESRARGLIKSVLLERKKSKGNNNNARPYDGVSQSAKNDDGSARAGIQFPMLLLWLCYGTHKRGRGAGASVLPPYYSCSLHSISLLRRPRSLAPPPLPCHLLLSSISEAPCLRQTCLRPERERRGQCQHTNRACVCSAYYECCSGAAAAVYYVCVVCVNCLGANRVLGREEKE